MVWDRGVGIDVFVLIRWSVIPIEDMMITNIHAEEVWRNIPRNEPLLDSINPCSSSAS